MFRCTLAYDLKANINGITFWLNGINTYLVSGLYMSQKLVSLLSWWWFVQTEVSFVLHIVSVVWCYTLHCVVLVVPSPFPTAENCSLVSDAAVKPFIRETQQRPLTHGVVPTMFLSLLPSHHPFQHYLLALLSCHECYEWYLLFTQHLEVLAEGYWQFQGWSHSYDVTWFATCHVKKHLIRNGTAKSNNCRNSNLTVHCCVYTCHEMLQVHLQWYRSPNSGQLLNRWTSSGFD